MSEQKKVEVPDNVYVECPMIEKKLRLVADCLGCEHYSGLSQRFQEEKTPFRIRFQVRCRFPFARAIFETEIKDAGTF